MEMKSNKTEILGAVKLDYIHVETCFPHYQNGLDILSVERKDLDSKLSF